MIIPVNLGEKSYDIIIDRGALSRVGEIVGVTRRVCIVSDSGVPTEYTQTIAAQFGEDTLTYTFPQGEASKCFDTFLSLQKTLLDAHFTRSDALIAVGGGVVGDLTGFVAATYMRGIDFYNVPTTVLSQVDSSVGGKTAVDFAGYKNMIGAFHQPRAVIIDPETLLTLPTRQVANGLAEALKMGLSSDAALFSLFEEEPLLPAERTDAMLAAVAKENTLDRLADIITRAVSVKRDVVQTDERESGLRRVLNLGHTLGHAVESCLGLGAAEADALYHGECVAIGLLPVCGESIRPRVKAALQKLGLPTAVPEHLTREALCAAIKHDKKAGKSTVTVVLCDKIGSFSFEEMTAEMLVERV